MLRPRLLCAQRHGDADLDFTDQRDGDLLLADGLIGASASTPGCGLIATLSVSNEP